MRSLKKRKDALIAASVKYWAEQQVLDARDPSRIRKDAKTASKQAFFLCVCVCVFRVVLLLVTLPVCFLHMYQMPGRPHRRQIISEGGKKDFFH